MPRQGRQPKQLTSASTQRKQRPAQPAQQPKKGGKGKSATSRHNNDDDDEPSALDVYAYKARVKRPRGDVDPLAKASAKSGKQQQQSKGKGKGRAPAQDDDEELEDDDEEDEDLSDEEGGFRIHGDEAIEWTGRKPAGFKLGMDSDEEGGKFVGFDEDIDSDLASGSEEDLPRASGSGKGKKGKKGVESTAIDLDEDEIDWDDEDGAGYMDLTELLDAGGYPSGSEDDEAGSGSGDEDDEQDEDEDMSDDESEITSDDEGALEKLDSFVEGLDSKKRKAGDDGDDAGGKKKKRVVLKERTEALPEGEFAAVNADEGKVNLDDLLSSFSDSKNPRLASLRKSLKPLTGSSSSSSTDKVTTSNSHLKSSGALAAPLPGRLQDKIDREAAYEKTKEETDKWNETVRRMKGESGLGVEGARHERLTLPLLGGAGDVRRDPNAAEWNAKFQATNELEASIQNLLAAGQMSQSDLQKREQQELAKLDPAELAARQAELRRQRDLMYRAERKAKRVAKIKSKAYRRIHRKSKEKNGENGPQLSLEDLAELDAIDGGNRVEEERTRLELLRAKERATLKHSSKGGRWAKKIDGLEGLEEERNASIRDMVARREELRRKIAGVGSDEEVDEFASSGSDDGMGGSDDDDGGDFDSVRRKAFDELASLDAKEAAAKANDPKLKGVMNMKFMRDAMARADREVQKEADELRDRLARMDEMGEGGESADEEDGPGAMSEQVQGNLGRMVFGPSGAGQTAAPEAEFSSAAPKASRTTKLSSVSIASPLVAAATASTSRPTPRSRPSLRDPSASADADSSSNPWLTLADDEPSSSTGGSGAKLSRKLNKASFGKDSASAADKSANKAARARGKQADAREADREDAKVEIDVSGEAALSSAASAGGKKGKGKAKAAPVQVGGAMVARPAEGMEQGRENDEDESDGEMDEEEIEAQRGRGPAAFKQRALVKEAFANDDVVADFAEAKRKEIERDAPREEDNTLPGWGSWGGKGAKKQKNPRKFITKIAGVDADKRKDAGLNHVIISEKKDRKAAKYMLKDLPFPYTSAAQHEHKLRTPMGPEWSTSTILRDQTMPSVLIKPGVSIRPVDKKVQ